MEKRKSTRKRSTRKKSVAKTSFDFTTKKPISVWNRPLEADFASFFGHLGKSVAGFAFAKWDSAAKSVIDALGAIGLKAAPEELAWRLIFTALIRASDRLVQEAAFGDLFEQNDFVEAERAVKYITAFESLEISLEPDFFQRPGDLPLIVEYRPVLQGWLTSYGVPEPRARAICGRLESYFVLALIQEWRTEGGYEPLANALDTPFTQAGTKQRGWLEYAAWLRASLCEPMFDESFSLADIYVPLRAAYDKEPPTRGRRQKADAPEESSEECKSTRTAVDLADHLRTWALSAKSGDAVRVLAGGPGSGKSSFCKIFAAEYADELRAAGITTLLIPLHHFRPDESLPAAVGRFVADTGRLGFNPLDPEFLKSGSVLLLFDGLDELSQQGHVGAQVASDFVRDIESSLTRINTEDDARLRVVLTGRELVIQANRAAFRGERLLDVLPFCRTKDSENWPVDGDDSLLDNDQRHAWWKRYGELSGAEFEGLPPELDTDNLREITAQPLLNYLVALSKDRDKIEFTSDTSLNEVYEDLIEAVYERGWEGKRPDRTRRAAYVGDLSQDEFFLMLEEIAVSAWHGDGRKTSCGAIEVHLRDVGLIDLLRKVEEGAKAGITRLLVAFFFREAEIGGVQTESAFEFTHKSFGEYLTARRLVRLLGRIVEERLRQQADPTSGWNEPTALVEWARVAGPTRMDSYLFPFFVREIAQQLKDDDEARVWRDVLHELFQFAVLQGTPMEKVATEPFQILRSRADHAEESLLAAYHSGVIRVGDAEALTWPKERMLAFGSWLHRVRGQCDMEKDPFFLLAELPRRDPPVVLLSLAYLKFRTLVADCQDLLSANLTGAGLRNASLEAANFEEAKLEGADLEGARLENANLERANLERTNLNAVNLNGANLYAASLVGANLEGATLGNATLSSANFNGARIRRDQLSIVQMEQIVGEPDWIPEDAK